MPARRRKVKAGKEAPKVAAPPPVKIPEKPPVRRPEEEEEIEFAD